VSIDATEIEYYLSESENSWLIKFLSQWLTAPMGSTTPIISNPLSAFPGIPPQRMWCGLEPGLPPDLSVKIDGWTIEEMRNAYPYEYQKAYHSFVQEKTGGDGVLFSRSGYAGVQAFPCHWAGDEDPTFEAFRASIRAGLSAGVSGIVTRFIDNYDTGVLTGLIDQGEGYYLVYPGV